MLEPMLVGDFDGVVSRPFATCLYPQRCELTQMCTGHFPCGSDLQEAVQEVCSRAQGLKPVSADVSPASLLVLTSFPLPAVLLTRTPLYFSSHDRSYLFLFPIALIVAYLAWRFTLAN